jgi:hypothetical protein
MTGKELGSTLYDGLQMSSVNQHRPGDMMAAESQRAVTIKMVAKKISSQPWY